MTAQATVCSSVSLQPTKAEDGCPNIQIDGKLSKKLDYLFANSNHFEVSLHSNCQAADISKGANLLYRVWTMHRY